MEDCWRTSIWAFIVLMSITGFTSANTFEDRCGGCLNGGNCTQNSSAKSGYACRCPVGYAGHRCELSDYCKNAGVTSPNVNPCFNGGKCTSLKYGFNCTCPQGFQGERCNIDIDECTNSNMCLNGGQCQNLHGSFRCNCNGGFEGKRCEINVDDCEQHDCKNGAQCIDGVDKYKCACLPGQSCEHRDLCFFDKPCVHGDCVLRAPGEYRCRCRDGYTGRNCDEDVNECLLNPCADRGSCVNTPGSFQCSCKAGWEGKTCSVVKDYCNQVKCANGASCVSKQDHYQCICVVGFSGQHCEIRDDKNCKLNCQNGGHCLNETHCICSNSYTGQFCDIAKPNPCEQQPCVHGGMCQTTREYDDFKCACPEGYTGRFCEHPVCDSPKCSMRPFHCNGDKCLNGGTCISLEDSYKCHCPLGYSGLHCDMQNSTILNLLKREDENSHGQLTITVLGDADTVQRHSNDILAAINNVVYADVKLSLDNNNQPMIYQWDSVNGIGDRLGVKNLDNDIYISASDDDTKRGVIMMLNVDVRPCQKLNLSKECPTSVVQVAAELLKQRTQTALKPLGVSIYRADANGQNDSSNSTAYKVAVCAALAVLLVMGLYTVLTNFNKGKKSLLRRTNSRRHPNQISAAIYVPPMEKPLISNLNAFDCQPYLPFNLTGQHVIAPHHNFGMNNSSTLEQLRVNPLEEAKLLPERANFDEHVHAYAQQEGPIKELDEHIDVNKRDHVLRTALHWVIVLKPDEEAVQDLELLFQKGADLNAIDFAGNSPLMLAASYWRNNTLTRLIERGADPSLANGRGQTALHMAVNAGNEPAVVMLSQIPNVDVNATTVDEDTPLKLAAMQGDVAVGIVSQLLKVGAAVECTGDAGTCNAKKRTALHEAALLGANQILELLLRNHAQVDVKDANLQTPLHLAAASNHLSSLQTLLRWNANKTLEDIDGRTPAQLAEMVCFDVGVRELSSSNASTPESMDNFSYPAIAGPPPMVNTLPERRKTAKKPVVQGPKRKSASISSSSNGSPPTKQTCQQMPSTMLSPSSERYTPPQYSYEHYWTDQWSQRNRE